MKKIFAMLLTAAITVSLIACGGSGSSNNTTSTDTAASEDGAASEALADGKLIVGTNAEFPPFEYLGDNGEPDGFDIALIKAIGEKLGVEVEIQNMEFGSLITSIGSKIDVSIAGMTVTEERKNAVDFSDSYYDAVQFVILPADSTIAAKEDLLGKTIGCQLGTTGEYLIDDLIAEDGATEKKSYNKAVDAVNDLLNGRLDCVIIDNEQLRIRRLKRNLKLYITLFLLHPFTDITDRRLIGYTLLYHKVERRSLSVGALHIYPAVHHIKKAGHYAHSKARSFDIVISLFLYPLKAYEKIVYILFFYTYSGILYFHIKLDGSVISALLLHNELYFAARSVFNGICKQVHYDLSQADIITDKGRGDIRIYIKDKIKALGHRSFPYGMIEIVYNGRSIIFII